MSPLKTPDLCERCRLNFNHKYQSESCFDCKMESTSDSQCKCSSIKWNTPCQYFSEVEDAEFSKILIKPDGVHSLSPHKFVLKEKLKNVTVEILECEDCGEISVGWYRQENTEVCDG